MKVLCAVLALCSICSATPIEIAKSEQRVSDAEAIFYEDRWYMALIVEPIYTLSERGALCDRVKNRVLTELGLTAEVLIDTSLFFDIKYAKTLTGDTQKDYIENRIKRIYLRRSNEYREHYQSQEKGVISN